MNYFQTDSIFNKNINRFACLFFSLMDIAEKYTGKLFSHMMIIKLYYLLIEKDIMNTDCWVKDHTAVIRESVLMLTGENVKVKYNGAWYHPNFTKRKSWGNLSGKYQIMQFFTHSEGHFARKNYDPYRPLINTLGLISERYYDIEAA